MTWGMKFASKIHFYLIKNYLSICLSKVNQQCPFKDITQIDHNRVQSIETGLNNTNVEIKRKRRIVFNVFICNCKCIV